MIGTSIDLFPHSPKDEYQVEIDQISNLLDKSTEVEHLASNINTIFKRRFGDDVFTLGILDAIIYSTLLTIAVDIAFYIKSGLLGYSRRLLIPLSIGIIIISFFGFLYLKC